MRSRKTASVSPGESKHALVADLLDEAIQSGGKTLEITERGFRARHGSSESARRIANTEAVTLPG
jgi:hypothetical protein